MDKHGTYFAVRRGPNWIHGAENNPISDLAKRTGTTICGWDDQEAVFHSNGRPMDPVEVEEYNGLLWDDGIIDAATKLSREQRESIDPQRSLYDFAVEKVQGLFTHENPSVAERKRKTLLLVASTWGAWVGSPVQKQSLRNFWLEDWIDGENVFVAETYSKILGEVAKSAQKGAEIRLNCPVTGIQCHSNSTTEVSARSMVRSANGEAEFDEVVVCTPLGWLKRNMHAFDPALPKRFAEAVQSVGYGTLDKVYITFPSAFWDRTISNSSESSQDVPNGMPITNSSAENSHWPGFTHWLSPDYAVTTNPEKWDQEAMNLAALPVQCAHSTLLFYIHGDCSVHIAQLVANASNDEQRDEALFNFFRPYYSLLPNYEKTKPECKPKAILATAWANDEFAGYGSYSNFQIGLVNGAQDIEVMRHGVPERHLWFGGEHTAPIEFTGTTTGAYLSGEAVARRIAEAHGLTEKSI